ncbi:ABC transporter permease [Rhodovulum sulfidophilum]|nr:ABC transporter permease [Rhodovulum sulfidophilum]
MVSPLDRKILRDLGRMKGQALAIAMVLAMGVMLQVAMSGVVSSLDETKKAYFASQRMADMFAPLDQAPRWMLDRLAQVPGIARIEGRVTGAGLMELAGEPLPVRVLAVSLPRHGRPQMNDVYLVRGRWPDPAELDQVMVLKSFAEARGLEPGSRITLTLNGGRDDYRIAALVEAPEFIYATPPGELAPDDARFAVIWMNGRKIEAVFEQKESFNEALIGLDRDADPRAVARRVDRLLDRYGSLGPYPLSEQSSNRFVSDEIDGMRRNARSVPPVFLGVAAYLLAMVVSRMIQAERGQIGLLKAFGYTSSEISLHYLKLAMLIALAGAAIGCGLGTIFCKVLAGFYGGVFRFPFLVFRIEPPAYVLGTGFSLAAACLGAVLVLRRVFRLAPAEAMRPPVPPAYGRWRLLPERVSERLDQPTRMVLRRLARQPLRAGGAVLGIALGMALSVTMINLIASFNRTVEMNFDVVDRSDIGVTLTRAVGRAALYDLRRLPGVLEAEGRLDTPAMLRHGTYSYRGSITGLSGQPRLKRALDLDLVPIALPPAGQITLSQAAARMLEARPGDRIEAHLMDGRRPHLELTVAGVSQTYLGAPAYMRLDALGEALGKPGQISDIALRIDPAYRAPIAARLAEMPLVAGIAIKTQTRAALSKVMNTGAGAIRFVMAVVAAVMSFGIVYNSARIAFAERQQDLASLMVLGYEASEAVYVLLAEFVLLAVLALPLGAVLGRQLSRSLAAAFSTDIYTLPAVTLPAAAGIAALAVAVAVTFSCVLVARDVMRIDLLMSLKARE